MAVVVIALSPQHHNARPAHSRYTPDRAAAAAVTRRVFAGNRSAAMCVARYESHWTLAARNGVNLGPWQINLTAHPWANPWLLTHSWRYSARVAYRISAAGSDWAAWSTASLCGLT